jgi:hypothetical protein
MVAVALASLLMAIGLEVRRELRLARRYRAWADAWGHCLVWCDGRRGDQRLAAYYPKMKRKYERAASRAWLPVESDPYPPEL